MTKARRFNDNDWMGLAGAECFGDKSDPFHRTLDSGLEMCADANGVHAYDYDDKTDSLSVATWDVQWPTAEAARMMLDSFVDTTTMFELEKLGFDIDHEC